jgi:ATP-dependent helicase HepA
MPTVFHPGQRWMSESEPGLGLGSVRLVTLRTVTIVFGASDETREYARDDAPLRRVRFRVGDRIKSRADVPLTVQSITERDGLLYYHGDGQDWCETELHDAISFTQSEDRLLAGHFDPTELFDLRVTALEHQHRRGRSPVRGLLGGRIDLIGHQLYIASEVAGRLAPRVLLADEVGLGKTIEACLILHRMILTGRAQRVLILVPESLVLQWFVELLRRFHLWFHIFDEARCEAIEADSPESNPFLDDQLVLGSISLFTGKEQRLRQAQAAGWDMLVVDEAHHLGWSPGAVSPEYATVEALGRTTPGLLLLTATPEQLGLAGHFARLRLLDPDRFYDLKEFIQEAENYAAVARLADRLLARHELTTTDITALARILAETEADVRLKLEKLAQVDSAAREELLDALLDRHGTGRVMFRNTRATVTGFPGRTVRMCPLPAPVGRAGRLDALAREFSADTSSPAAGASQSSPVAGTLQGPPAAGAFQPDLSTDRRIDWLADLLQALDRQKVLLICGTPTKVAAIDAALRQRSNLKQAMFHEGQSLVQRDRAAAWFAERDGARILLCSEIGSEGRNFQFAHHLVLFDLPLDPELLEQRIGRLDRIGQTSEIQVHVPFFAGSPQEVPARWHHEGLNSLAENLRGGRELLGRFGTRVHDLAQDFHGAAKTSRAELRRLIVETRSARKELAERLERGRDRLLELNSWRPEVSARIAQEIRTTDEDQSLDDFMTSILAHFFVQVEEIGPRTYRIGSAGLFADCFPGLPTEGLTVTCDRQRALAREDMQFLTWDHPLVTGALDLLLGSGQGNSSFARWPDDRAPGLYLEATYVLECVAPLHLHIDRFLPPTPVRVVVDHRGRDVGSSVTRAILNRHLRPGDAGALFERRELREEVLPGLIDRAQEIARGQVPGLIAQAHKEMVAQLEHETTRLQELRKVNRAVRVEEIELLAEQRRALDRHLSSARLRLDAVRLVQRGPG